MLNVIPINRDAKTANFKLRAIIENGKWKKENSIFLVSLFTFHILLFTIDYSLSAIHD